MVSAIIQRRRWFRFLFAPSIVTFLLTDTPKLNHSHDGICYPLQKKNPKIIVTWRDLPVRPTRCSKTASEGRRKVSTANRLPLNCALPSSFLTLSLLLVDGGCAVITYKFSQVQCPFSHRLCLRARRQGSRLPSLALSWRAFFFSRDLSLSLSNWYIARPVIIYRKNVTRAIYRVWGAALQNLSTLYLAFGRSKSIATNNRSSDENPWVERV